MEFDRTNTGIISKNDRKQTDKHPDITGTLNVGGVDYFIDGWRKERKDGTGSFYSLRVKQKDRQGATPPAREDAPQRAAQGRHGGGDLDDSIPFGPEVR